MNVHELKTEIMLRTAAEQVRVTAGEYGFALAAGEAVPGDAHVWVKVRAKEGLRNLGAPFSPEDFHPATVGRHLTEFTQEIERQKQSDTFL